MDFYRSKNDTKLSHSESIGNIQGVSQIILQAFKTDAENVDQSESVFEKCLNNIRLRDKECSIYFIKIFNCHNSDNNVSLEES